MPYSDWFLLGTLTHPLGIAESLFEGKESSCKVNSGGLRLIQTFFSKSQSIPKLTLTPEDILETFI